MLFWGASIAMMELTCLLSLAPGCRDGREELFINVIQDCTELLSLWLAHVLAQQLVASRFVLAYALDLRVHANLVQHATQECTFE